MLFRHDAVKADLANVLAGDICRCMTDQEPSEVFPEQPIERSLALLDRLTAKVSVIEVEEIKRVELGKFHVYVINLWIFVCKVAFRHHGDALFANNRERVEHDF